jgi:hypothetical protein
MPEESSFSRALWTVALTAAVVIVVLSFARRPLLESDGATPDFSRPLVLWVTGDEASGQAAALASQAASRWGAAGHGATVGVLPGDSSTAVLDFLQHMRPNELMLVTSATLAGIVRDRADRLLPEEVRERARRASRLLERANSVALLAVDPLGLVVRAGSPIDTASQVLSLLHRTPPRPLFEVAANAWLQDNLAELVHAAGLHGAIPYGVFGSSRQAVRSLDAGEDGVAVAPRSMLRDEVRSGRLRELGWPSEGSLKPRSWIAVLATPGLGSARISALRSQADALEAGADWRRLLAREGLSPARRSPSRLRSFLHDSLHEASQLQAIAARVMREHD